MRRATGQGRGPAEEPNFKGWQRKRTPYRERPEKALPGRKEIHKCYVTELQQAASKMPPVTLPPGTHAHV